MKNINKIITAIAVLSTLLLAFLVFRGYSAQDELSQKNQQLQEQLEVLTKESNRSAVMQRVNAQMEEIANEERRISEEQRDAAEQQTKVAEEMRRKAEIERQNALTAQKQALEASEVAQRQRAIAEHQRAEAEMSKRVTDTLSYITLARTLGNTAINQYKAGNNDLADLLAYTACMYTNRYHGDIYSPTVYQALAMTSQNNSIWNKHKGSVTDIAFAEQDAGYFVTCSTYGEVMKHRIQGNRLTSETLVSDPKFDFRDIFINRDNDIIYALDRSGYMLIIDGKKITKLAVNIPKLKGFDAAGSQYIIVGEQGMALFDTEKNIITKQKQLPFKVEFHSRYQGYPVIFDQQGHMYIIKSFDNLQVTQVPVKGQVTAFAESKNQHMKAYGMSDGTLYVIKGNGEAIKLVGHRSRISKLKANGQRLYSASYDGMLNLWLTNLSKIEPMTLFTTRGWIINFTFDLKKERIWTGDQYGNLTQASISVTQMQQRLKNKLKRNLTHEEWNYYIGKNIPYEDLIGKEGGR